MLQSIIHKGSMMDLSVIDKPQGSASITTTDQDWWRGAVIYQIYPRSFQDSNGDGIGDLIGITSRLEYLANLGVDAIWLSPFFTSPMKDMGYDVSDYCGVDPVFGTLDDFKTLTRTAHKLGLKVMIDQVLSHSSDQHPWYKESKISKTNDKSDWYIWADANADGTPPTNWQSIFGGPAWTWSAKRKQYYFHNFLASQPDLNFHNVEVQDALLDSVRFWLELGVDGFRLDTVNFFFHDEQLRDNPSSTETNNNDVPDMNPYGFQQHIFDKTRPENLGFLKRFRTLLNQYPGAASVGEVGDGNRSLQTMAEYTAGEDKLHMCYSFDLLGPQFSSNYIRNCVEQFEAASQQFANGSSWACWAFSNHDVNRHMSRWSEKVSDKNQFAKLLASLLLSLKGSVCLYQGEELGFQEAELKFEDLTDPVGLKYWPEHKGRDGCRTPMAWESTHSNGGFTTANKSWLPVAELHVISAANLQVGQSGSIFEHYRNFLDFRKTNEPLVQGDIEFIDCHQDGIAFYRHHQGQSILCLFNLSENPLTFNLPKGHDFIALQRSGFIQSPDRNRDTNKDEKSVTLNSHQAYFAAKNKQ